MNSELPGRRPWILCEEIKGRQPRKNRVARFKKEEEESHKKNCVTPRVDKCNFSLLDSDPVCSDPPSITSAGVQTGGRSPAIDILYGGGGN